MRRTRVLAGASATAAIVLATLLIASPAEAATLPDGQRITVGEDETGAVFLADPSLPVPPEPELAAAPLTPAGPGFTVGNDFLSAIDVNDDGIGFGLITDGVQGDWDPSFVVPFDANTGVAGTPVPITIDLDPTDLPGLGCGGLDLLDGILYTACQDSNFETHFGSLDPVSGILTPITNFDEEIYFTAFASNPVTGEFWAWEYRDSDGFSGQWIVDPETWEFTTDLDLTPFPVWDADFDRDGQLFVSTYLEDSLGADYAAVALLNPASGEFTDFHYFDLDGHAYEEQEFALTVWGNVPAEPVLPATGAGDAVPFGLAAALLLLMGGAFVALQRRRA